MTPKIQKAIDHISALYIAQKFADENKKTKDLSHIYGVLSRMDFKPMGEVEREMSQFGMYFDGQTLHVDEEEVESNSHVDVCNTLLNFVTNYLIGTYNQSGNGSINWVKSYFGLIMSHLGFNDIQPKYAQSMRAALYDKFYSRIYPNTFATHTNSFSYFMNRILKGEIKPYLPFTINEKLDFPAGTIVKYTFSFCHLTSGSGLELQQKGEFSGLRYDTECIVVKEGNDYKVVSGHSRVAKDIKNAIKIIETLSV